MADKYSKVLVAEWSDYEQVGILDNVQWSIRVYEDRTIYKHSTVKWVNNSGSVVSVHERFDGRIHERLLKLAEQEKADDADYTMQAHAIADDNEGPY